MYSVPFSTSQRWEQQEKERQEKQAAAYSRCVDRLRTAGLEPWAPMGQPRPDHPLILEFFAIQRDGYEMDVTDRYNRLSDRI
jgi:hypothetical protein